MSDKKAPIDMSVYDLSDAEMQFYNSDDGLMVHFVLDETFEHMMITGTKTISRDTIEIGRD